MSSESIHHEQQGVAAAAAHDLHEEHHHHHGEESFISKYVFSQDHKMIAKQFLITGMIWAIIGGLFSVFFRLQLGYPEMTFPFLEDIFGKWAVGGRISNEFYYALVTMHGTILVFFVLTAGLERNFCQLPDTSSDWRKGYGFSIPEYAFLLVLLSGQCNHVCIPLYTNRAGFWWMDDLSSAKCTWSGF